MAIRRMFSKRVIETTSFLRMPATAQALYYFLGMQADDDGVVEAFMVLRMAGASEDDLKLLHEKGFVYILNDELVTYIMDFRENNKLRADRKVDSRYQKLVLEHLPDTEFLESRERADLKSKTAADAPLNDVEEAPIIQGQTTDRQMTTDGRPPVNPMPEEGSVVEVRLGKYRLDQFNVVEEVEKEEPQQPTEEVTQNDFNITPGKTDQNPEPQPQENIASFVNYQSFVDEYHRRCPSLRKIGSLTPKRKQRLKKLLSRYTVEQIMLAFDKAQASAILRGECNGKGYESFLAGFDWIVNENNFVKILEGKYDSRSRPSYLDQPGIYESLEPLLLEN